MHFTRSYNLFVLPVAADLAVISLLIRTKCIPLFSKWRAPLKPDRRFQNRCGYFSSTLLGTQHGHDIRFCLLVLPPMQTKCADIDNIDGRWHWFCDAFAQPFRFFYFLEISGRRSSLTVFVWSTYHASWCSEPFKDVWTTRSIAGKQFLAFKLVFYMKIQLESRRLQEQANTGTSVLSFQWGNFISNGKGGRILKPKEALVKLICNRSH